MLKGTTGSAFGSAIEYVPRTNPDNTGALLIGAPNENAGAGAVYFADMDVNVIISVGAGTDALGSSLNYGGNADKDMLQDDLLAGAPGGGYVRVMDLAGVLIDDVTGTSMTSWGASVAWAGSVVANGFDEILVGDPGAAFGAGQADLLYGGPMAVVDQNYGAGCTTNGSPVPVLTENAPLIPGMSYTMSISGALPFSTGFLYLGQASPTGIPIGPCTAFLGPGLPAGQPLGDPHQLRRQLDQRGPDDPARSQPRRPGDRPPGALPERERHLHDVERDGVLHRLVGV